ncbi:MAG: serine hydrolase [Patescibacteria group bacterium]
MFGKKEENETEEFDQELVRRPIRDLKPENKKARKEPVKPWGKKERLTVLSVLLATFFVSALFAVLSSGFSVPKVSAPNISISIPNIKFEQTFVSEKKACCSDIEEKFKEKTDSLLGTYGFSFIDLTTGKAYSLKGNESFQAASLIKLPTAVALYKEAEVGKLDLDSVHTLSDSEKLEGNGSLAGFPTGTKITYRNIVKYMLTQSDNTAFNIVEIFLGDRKIQKTIDSLGMTKTSIADNLTSADDIALILRELKEGNILNPIDSDEILSYLKQSKFDSWLVAGIPQGVEIAHKYGREIGVVNDAGIIYSPRPYILVILSKEVNEKEADSIFPELSKLFYDEVSK